MADLAFVKQHNMVAYLEKTEENADFHQILDFLTSSSINFALTVSPTIYASYIEQFWNTACLKTINSKKQIHANIDGKAVVVSESSIRRDLHLNDEDGTACLTTNEIFENLALMGYEPASDKLTFYKGLFSPQWKYLIHTILHCLSSKSTSWDQFSTNLASAIICLANGQKFNFSKLIFDVTNAAASQPPKDSNTYRRTQRGQNTKVPQSSGSPNKVGDEAINEEMLDSVERVATAASSLEAEQASGNTNKTQFTTTLNEPFYLELGSGSGPWRQETMGGMQAQTRSEGVSNLSSDPPLSGGYTLRSGEDNMEHQIELTDNVPNTPHDSPLPGGFDLEKVKTTQAKEITGLKRRVTKLEQRQRSRIIKNHPFRFGSSRRQSVGIAFVQEKDTEVLDTEKTVNTAGEEVSTASDSETVSTAAPRTPPTKTIVFDDEDVTMAMAQTLIKMNFVNNLLEKWLSFSQGLRNANHTQTFDLANIYGRVDAAAKD
ncbi:hypothetical protein Tco_0157402 [Tanacetum coccineum]